MYPPLWHIQEGDHMPLVATAIHDGHALRAGLYEALALTEDDCMREEDPNTGIWARTADTWVIANRSRFEVDLNRPRDKAIYRTSEDAWGLWVWRHPPDEAMIATSLAQYDDFYATMQHIFHRMERRFGRFVVYDLHTYNHRRDGPDAPPADPASNPDVNVGTGTMLDRSRWAGVIERFMHDLRAAEIVGRHLDVRENVKFRGGHFAHWTHRTFPQSACVLSIEFKKFFMDEWYHNPYDKHIIAIREALKSTMPGVVAALSHVEAGT
jgi:N-formylglutamate deformylase